nr:bifunctional phosphopantothenoylcysteine decarboxylase/phosphopantothenate--cysteine ligase CoaBC [Thermoleophilaceae bacterium]
PLVLAPAMNDRMLGHPATRTNLETLAARGAHVVPPGTGELASKGEWGAGRLAEPADVLAAVEQSLGPSYAPRSLDGMRVLVTAGGTREPIDAVRYVGNRSSGRMGFALAEEAARRGADVTVIAASVDLPHTGGVDYVEVETAAELEAATRRAARTADVVLMTAAVADFRPSAPAAAKIAKSGRGELALSLEPTPDVLAGLAAVRPPDQTIVGFAAEHRGEGGAAAVIERARDKLIRKRVDAIVVNDISLPGIGFDAADNEVTIVTASGNRPVPRAAKPDVARAILDAVTRLRAAAVASKVERGS